MNIRLVHLLAFLFSIPFFADFGNAILSGEEIQWTRNGFLAKVLARERPDGLVRSCSGSLISASLVLTSGQCVMHNSRRDSGDRQLRQGQQQPPAELAVLLTKPDSRQQYGSTAKLLELSEHGQWALLRIQPQNITQLCPPHPAPKWVSRLNFRPSLTERSRLSVDHKKLSASGCHMIGFFTADKAEDFVTQQVVFRLYLEGVAPPADDEVPKHYRSTVYDNFTACYDDGGAPLFCKLTSLEELFQIGLFQGITTVSDGKQQTEEMPLRSRWDDKNGNDTSNAANSSREEGDGAASNAWDVEKCRRAKEMRFTLFNDDDALARAIERHAMAEFVQVYQQCGFMDDQQ